MHISIHILEEKAPDDSRVPNPREWEGRSQLGFPQPKGRNPREPAMTGSRPPPKAIHPCTSQGRAPGAREALYVVNNILKWILNETWTGWYDPGLKLNLIFILPAKKRDFSHSADNGQTKQAERHLRVCRWCYTRTLDCAFYHYHVR